ncbi:PH domain-containing protein [Streptoalloteichus hindustanus]|uniref:PH domain-containing protein n=1 Tax=Streptoalloteichus hindustanus TaxID=2017 RepID=A0A1M4XYP2_STRHI|nr:PH domain-containing protein [Streptoalloteichus hindustanus]SHE98555.1 PH domain-containing protein [Streptoalloteichus hindustanus]
MSTMTETQPQPLVVRPHKAAVVAWAVAIVLVAVFTVVAVLLKNTPTGVFFRTADQVAMVGVGVLLAAAALLFTRPRVRADAESIEVRNIYGTTRYPWSEVEALSFPDGASFARLELPDDEYVSIMAIQSTDGERAVHAMRALRRLYRASRT